MQSNRATFAIVACFLAVVVTGSASDPAMSQLDFIEHPETIPDGFRLVPNNPGVALGALVIVEISGEIRVSNQGMETTLKDNRELSQFLGPKLRGKRKAVFFQPSRISSSRDVLLAVMNACNENGATLYLANGVIYRTVPRNELMEATRLGAKTSNSGMSLRSLKLAETGWG